jgi:hypothetical protein
VVAGSVILAIRITRPYVFTPVVEDHSPVTPPAPPELQDV